MINRAGNKEKAKRVLNENGNLSGMVGILLSMSSINLSKLVFSFVPMQDFSKPWTDAELYAKYNLTDEEIAFIESMIKPMELGGDE